MGRSGGWRWGLILASLAAPLGGCTPGCPSPGGAPPADQPPAASLPDITLISLDTLRQDRGPGPWGAGIMPRYAAFAAGAARYSGAWAPSSNTLVSHGSLFTGRMPWAHAFHPELPPPADAPDLIPSLAARGYTAAVFTTHPTWLGEAHRFDAGASTFRSEAVPGEEALRWVKAWLDTDPPHPRALFVHLYDAHSDTHRLPYEAPGLTEEGAGFGGCIGEVCASKMLRAVDEGRAQLPPGAAEAIALAYDAGVRHTDALLGQLLDLTEPTLGGGLVAVFSDHGELLGEEGRWLHHGGTPFVLDIPLAVRRPGQREGAQIQAPVSLVQLYDTVRGAAGIPREGARPLPEAEAGAEGQPVLAMNAARQGDRAAVERPGGAVSCFQRDPGGRWAAVADPAACADLGEAATGPQAWEASQP